MNRYNMAIMVSMMISAVFAVIYVAQGVAMNGSAMMMILTGVVAPLGIYRLKELGETHKM